MKKVLWIFIVVALVIAIIVGIRMHSMKNVKTENQNVEIQSVTGAENKGVTWSLETESEKINDVNSERIIKEINKVDALESQHLILTPSKSIENSNFIQTYNDVTVGNANNEKEKFHIEISINNSNGDFTLYGKDNLTKEELTKIFIDYFENSKIPDLTDWYEIEFY